MKAKKKPALRQLRLITTVNLTEKRQAERMARDEGFSSVSEFVRHVLLERHTARRAKAKAAKKRVSARKTVGSAKPTRKSGPRNGAASRSAGSAAKKTSKRRVVAVASNKPGRSARGGAKRRSATN